MQQSAAREHRTIHFLDCAGDGRPAPRLAEEGEFYIPDRLSGVGYEPDPDAMDAAESHAKALRRAERYLDDALILSQVLRAAMGDAGDSRAMQVDTVLAIVERKLGKARNRISRHEARHINLFLAYFELRSRDRNP